MATIVIDMSYVHAEPLYGTLGNYSFPAAYSALMQRCCIALVDACLAIPTTAPSAHTEFEAQHSHTHTMLSSA